jgi:hypothetical protein
MKTIEENNRLIAEFIGLTLEPWQGKDRLGDDDTDTEYWFDEQGNVIDALLYHESWDWIMPVVRKIVEICCNEDEEAFMSDQYTSILDVVPLALIDETYRVVVEFIEWYNQNQRKDGND